MKNHDAEIGCKEIVRSFPISARVSDQSDESKIGCVRSLGDCHDTVGI